MGGYDADDKNCYQLGPDDIWVPVGVQVQQKLGDVIYRYRSGIGQERMAYYVPTNPRTRAQQAWRSVYADGVAAWQGLSDNEKGFWRSKAKRSYLNGYLLFLQEWLLTHTPTAYAWTVGTTVIGSTDFIEWYVAFKIGTSEVGGPDYIKGPPPG